MKKNFCRKWLFFLLAGLLAVSFNFVSPVHAARIEIKMGTINTANSVDGLSAIRFKELVEKRSGKQIQVNIFHHSALGPTPAQVEGVMMGTQDILTTGTGPFEQLAADMKCLNILYLFQNDAHLTRFFNSPTWAKVTNQLKDKGIVLLNNKYNWITGPYRVLVSTKPIRTLEDVKGVKLRMPGVKGLQKGWAHLGANVVSLPWSEAYLALTQKIVDGLTAPISIIRPNKFTEVAKYITVIDTFPQRFLLAMNYDRYKNLSSEQQKLLHDCAFEAGEYYTQLVKESAQKDVEFMQKEQGVEFIQINRAKWRAAMVPFYKQLEDEGYLRKGLVAEIQALAK